MKEIMMEGKSDLQLAQWLRCDRASLAKFRRRIKPWVVAVFGAPKPKR
jgi:hypothetical protein